jgi:hypothetical protein
MYTLKKISPMYGTDAPNHEEVISWSESKEQCIEDLRTYYYDLNKMILSLPDVPTVIRELAERNLVRNSTIHITLNYEGVVFVDGVGPEMDYFTILEDA